MVGTCFALSGESWQEQIHLVTNDSLYYNLYVSASFCLICLMLSSYRVVKITILKPSRSLFAKTVCHVRSSRVSHGQRVDLRPGSPPPPRRDPARRGEIVYVGRTYAGIGQAASECVLGKFPAHGIICWSVQGGRVLSEMDL
jgi:hypothetical protein